MSAPRSEFWETVERIRAADGLHGRRIGFPREVTSAEQCRAVLIEMLADLRSRPR